MMKKVAIIIPAYRARFLAETLESIASQDCRDFNVYIGDDASPDELAPIIERYSGRMDLYYTRFSENLGGKDLCAQWKRCVALSHGEEWIWLFSDDDIMDPHCIGRLLACLKEDSGQADLFHFNVAVIDAEGNVTETVKFPELLSAKEFARCRFHGQLRSYAVEYVFRRSVYEEAGGFVPFDMAWNSDDATWISFAGDKGIRTIEGPKVRWRRSGVNITSAADALTLKRKLDANLEYVAWHKNRGSLIPAARTWFVTALYHSAPILSRDDIRHYEDRFARTYGCTALHIRILRMLKTLKRKLL